MINSAFNNRHLNRTSVETRANELKLHEARPSFSLFKYSWNDLLKRFIIFFVTYAKLNLGKKINRTNIGTSRMPIDILSEWQANFFRALTLNHPKSGNQIFRFAVNLLPPKAGCYSIISTQTIPVRIKS